MRKYNVAVLGATGAVGREMLAVLEERRFPVEHLTLLTSERSAGKKLVYNGEEYVCREAAKCDFSNIDIMLGAVSAELSRVYTPMAANGGAVVIDNSSAFRLEADVPLVVPEINPGAIAFHKGIIANPNCTTIIILTAVNAINEYSLITRLTAATYQAVSGAGADAVREMERQTREYANGVPLRSDVLDHPILHNLIPRIGDLTADGYSAEEMKLVNESRKILCSPDVRISCTCVRAPVIRCHSAAVTLECADEVSCDKAAELLKAAPGVTLFEGEAYPMPIDACGKDGVLVGRVRRDISGRGLCLWCCGDQLRKGAAANAVQIAELLVHRERGRT